MRKIYENSSWKIFPGFYESILYNSDTLYYFDCDEVPEGFYWEFVTDGFKKFCEETEKAWVEAMKLNLEENPLGLKIGRLISSWSPQFYNFTTDRISVEIEIDLNRLKRWCFKEHRAEFEDYLCKTWSSYSGFISFVPNSVKSFENTYKQGKDKALLIDIMIEWYLLNHVDFEYVADDCLESEWERISKNVALCDEKTCSMWDYEYTDKGYIPTKRIA